MEPSNIHSFIIRIWLEEIAEETGKSSWRGHITHVASNRQRYFEDLNVITSFIVANLPGVDVNVKKSDRKEDS
jgi:hypothetical protein